MKSYLLMVLAILVFLGIMCAVASDRQTHHAFIGAPPKLSKPYNILDYTKPASRP